MRIVEGMFYGIFDVVGWLGIKVEWFLGLKGRVGLEIWRLGLRIQRKI